MMRVWVLLLLVLAGCAPKDGEPAPRPVRAIQLEEAQAGRAYAFPGRTRAVGRVNLSFRVSGPLVERPVSVGDRVEKKQLLARIDPRDFSVQVQEVEGQLERAEAQLRFAERDYERSRNIWERDPGAISESMLDLKMEQMNQLKGEVKALKAHLKAARDQLRYTQLRAPYDGVIVATYVENYEFVQAKQPIVRLLDARQIEMVIDVPESMITDIDKVEKVEVRFDNYPDQWFPAKVKEIGTEASATTRTYPVTLVIDQPEDGLILPGMAGHAFLYGKEDRQQKGFVLPTTALFADGKGAQSYVWVIDSATNRVRKQPVVTGRLTSRGILVTKGLQTGEWVVTSGVYSLHEGQRVTIIPVTLNAQGEQVEGEASRARDHQVGG